MKGSCLIAQSGGPTAVINASACGVIQEAFKHSQIQDVYGSHNGILGILNEKLFDLRKEKPSDIEGLKYTPSSALGTCRYKLNSEKEYEKIIEVFQRYHIRYFFYIGGNDSQDTANKIHTLAKNTGYEIRVVGVPKTVDNDLAGTDHCPGYGSVIKLTAAMVREVGLDTEASYTIDKVNIIETMGRNTGWIAAGTSLAQEVSGQAPDMILLPEVPFEKDRVIERIRRFIDEQNRCVIVISEGVRYEDGTYLAAESSDLGVDSFGHQQLGGAAIELKRIIESTLKMKVRYCRPSIINRNGSHFASAVDAQEAYELGRSAVQHAMNGHSGVMMALIRQPEIPYSCRIEPVPLSYVANKEREFPTEWISKDGMHIQSVPFRKYALPLIQGEVPIPIKDGLPVPVRLQRYFI